jgi:IMP dehydrogenase
VIVETGTPTEETAREKFDKHRIEKLPVVDDQNQTHGSDYGSGYGEASGIIPTRHWMKTGNLVVGAAVSPS